MSPVPGGASRPPLLPYLGLLLALGVPSLGVVHKYLGVSGALGFLVLYAAALGLAYWGLLPRLLPRIDPARARWLSVVLLFALAGFFLVAYPAAESGRFGGGSDSDDALDLATGELLEGRYPYYPRTYLGRELSPMPGALLLAAPFVLVLGSATWLNGLSILALFAAARARLRDTRWALGLLALVALNPSFLHKLGAGFDYISNSLCVLLAIWWLVIRAERRPSRLAPLLLPTLLFALALSWRANFVLLVPLVYSLVGQRAGWRLANATAVLGAACFALVTLPFYFYDPAGFSPLHASGKLDRFATLLPHAALWVAAAAGGLALALARPRWNASEAQLFRNCALVQALPLAALGLLQMASRGAVHLEFAFFGDFVLFFGALSAWLALHERWRGPAARPAAAPRAAPGFAAQVASVGA